MEYIRSTGVWKGYKLLILRAGDRDRTGDVQLGKLAFKGRRADPRLKAWENEEKVLAAIASVLCSPNVGHNFVGREIPFVGKAYLG
ncbi:MAG: hypothetical protein DMG13_26910 [Acidobacteria bacterium]|nr:MAG: hypothetical protein DMG13_26910 [Acidobacteriota bacterium]